MRVAGALVPTVRLIMYFIRGECESYSNQGFLLFFSMPHNVRLIGRFRFLLRGAGREGSAHHLN